MKKIPYALPFTIILVCVTLFTACDDTVTPAKIVESGASGKISVNINGVEAAARTVFPSVAFDKCVYTFTKTGEAAGEVLSPVDGYFTLRIGAYTVAVEAYTGSAEPYTLAATGVSSEFNVTAYSFTSVSVTLSLVNTEGEGTFTYQISCPADTMPEITLQKWPDLDTVALNPASLAVGNGVTETMTLDAGSYLLSVIAIRAGLFAGINEVVYIYPAITTHYVKNYVDADFLNKLPGVAVGAPTVNNFTGDSITINPVDPPDNGQVVEYGINTSTSTAPSRWQTELTFTDLSGGIYYLYARSAENGNYIAGTANRSLPVMIVATPAHWSSALTLIRNGGNGTTENPKTYTIMIKGDVAVPVSISASTSFYQAQNIAVTLKGSGTLSLSGNGNILYLGSNQTLIIDDINLALRGRSGNNNAVLYVNGGALELKNGNISGNANSSNGGGVYLANGTFTMSGGEIWGNSAAYGGGVYMANGTFIMGGGIVYGRDISVLANNANGANGAALYRVNGVAQYAGGANILPPTDNTLNAAYTVSGTGTFTYNGAARTASVARKESASPGAITVLYNNTGNIPVDAGAYVVTYNVEAAAGFNAVTGLAAGTIYIGKANGAAVSNLSGISAITSSSVTVNAVPAPDNGQTVEYAASATNTAPATGWQSDTTLSGLASGATYYLFARAAEIKNYQAGAPSAGYQVEIPSYGISFTPSGTITFDAAIFGYGEQNTRNITVRNTGNQETGILTIALSGTNADSFTVSSESLDSIDIGGDGYFSVVPKTGLDAVTHTATVAVSGGNNVSAALNVSFTVSRATGAAVSAPSGTSSISSGSITINNVPAPENGQTVEYAISETNAAPLTGWQTGTTFGGLTAGTTYYFFARSIQNTNFYEGAASSGLKVVAPIPLTKNLWTDGSITSTTDGILYSFDVVSNTTYYVWWNDRKQGNNFKTLDIKASAYYNDGTIAPVASYQFADVDSGWTSAQSFTADRNGTVHLLVTPYDNTGTGTFAVLYNDTGSRPAIYTVTFNANGGSGSVPPVQAVQSGYSITLPSGNGLYRSSFSFGGWSTTSSGAVPIYPTNSSYTPTGNVTLFAKWNELTYTVSFNINGGQGTTPAPQTVRRGSSITLPNGNGFSRGASNTYTFAGWNSSGSGTVLNSPYTPDRDITLYAVWLDPYEVKFSVNGGTRNGVDNIPIGYTVRRGSSITLPNGNGVSRPGFTFGGWSTASSGAVTIYPANSSYTPTGNATLHAVWMCTISFNINGGIGTTPPSQTVSDRTNITLPGSSGFSMSGYYFDCWTTPSGNIEYGSSYSAQGTTTLYAKWVRRTTP